MLDSSKLEYTNYKDPRVGACAGFTEGFSGPLLFGTDKETGKEYIVKHRYPHNAASEYVGCALAGILGVSSPKAHLLSANRKFGCPYAVAIEYMRDLKSIDRSVLTETMKEDICIAHAFHFAFGTSDVVELRGQPPQSI